MKKGRISLKDIAQELDLSISTVSRALRDVGEIHPDTRNAVIELAKKWNYRPNPLAIGLLKRKTSTIGVIIPEIESHYFSSILKGIHHEADSKGYRIIATYSNDLPGKEIQSVEDLMVSQVEGILACPSSEMYHHAHYDQLIEAEIPVVLFEREIEELKVPQIVTDNYNACYEVTEHLITNGKKSIAFITSLEPLSVGKRRLEGYKDALLKHHIKFNWELVIHGTLNVSTSIEATRHLLEREAKPDAIICNNDSVCMVAMQVIKDHKLSIPDDIAIVGFNDDPYSSYLEPSLTSVSQPSYLMGIKATETLIKIIHGEMPPGLLKITLDSAMVARKSG